MKTMITKLISIFLVSSILSLLAYLGNKNSLSFDFTSLKMNTLSDKSLNVVKSINKDMSITVFAKRNNWSPILNLLELYKRKNKHINLSAVDIELNPHLLVVNNIDQENTILLEFESRKHQFVYKNELSVTNALLKVLRQEQISICFVRNHGEADIENTSADGAAYLKYLIENQSYNIVNLDDYDKLQPHFCRVLVILGPSFDLNKNESDKIYQYMQRGGRSLFLIDQDLKGKKKRATK